MGEWVEVIRVGGDVLPPEENVELLGFTPEREYLLLQGVYETYRITTTGRTWKG